jgi:hypothetical protein
MRNAVTGSGGPRGRSKGRAAELRGQARRRLEGET